MTLEATRWDGSEHLDNADSMILHIEDCLAEGDPALMALVLGDVAKAIGMTIIARQTGAERNALYQAIVSDGKRERAALATALTHLRDRLRTDPPSFTEAAE